MKLNDTIVKFREDNGSVLPLNSFLSCSKELLASYWYKFKSLGKGMGHFPDEDVSSLPQSRDPTDFQTMDHNLKCKPSSTGEDGLVKTPHFWAADRTFSNPGVVTAGRFPGMPGTSLPCG